MIIMIIMMVLYKLVKIVLNAAAVFRYIKDKNEETDSKGF